MPNVYPFRALTYTTGADQSHFVAPPYDVLDAAGKERLLKKDARNVVAIDLPHTPAKELGPSSAYEAAAKQLRDLLESKVLKKSMLPSMFAYCQTFKSADGSKSVRRSGMCCTVETVPFGPRVGGGILPHEETFSGPKEDRMALMKATSTQMSPIFGLHADELGMATKLIQMIMSRKRPDFYATTDDGTLHEIWTVQDSATINMYQRALANEDIFIADGHHRYNTGLSYLQALEAKGEVAANHPARRCMIVLIGMSDPGLVIWPTHRVLGGMKDYSFDKFKAAAAGQLTISPAKSKLGGIEAEMEAKAAETGKNVFGLYDFATGSCSIAELATIDPLAARFGEKPQAWRDLDVALIQYVIVEGVCQPKLNNNEAIKWAFPHTIKEVEDIGKGVETGAGGGKNFAQLAVIVRPTPLKAVKDVSRANQLMPQKSTFFYPKIATGLFMNPLA